MMAEATAASVSAQISLPWVSWGFRYSILQRTSVYNGIVIAACRCKQTAAAALQSPG